MGNITKKEIKKLLKAVRDKMVEEIENSADEKITAGSQIEVDVKILMGMGSVPSSIELSNEDPITFSGCFWICYKIDGRRYCWQYCI